MRLSYKEHKLLATPRIMGTSKPMSRFFLIALLVFTFTVLHREHAFFDAGKHAAEPPSPPAFLQSARHEVPGPHITVAHASLAHALAARCSAARLATLNNRDLCSSRFILFSSRPSGNLGNNFFEVLNALLLGVLGDFCPVFEQHAHMGYLAFYEHSIISLSVLTELLDGTGCPSRRIVRMPRTIWSDVRNTPYTILDAATILHFYPEPSAFQLPIGHIWESSSLFQSDENFQQRYGTFMCAGCNAYGNLMSAFFPELKQPYRDVAEQVAARLGPTVFGVHVRHWYDTNSTCVYCSTLFDRIPQFANSTSFPGCAIFISSDRIPSSLQTARLQAESGCTLLMLDERLLAELGARYDLSPAEDHFAMGVRSDWGPFPFWAALVSNHILSKSKRVFCSTLGSTFLALSVMRGSITDIVDMRSLALEWKYPIPDHLVHRLCAANETKYLC